MKNLLLLIVLLLTSNQIFSQITIKGTISDSLTSESLIGATVFVKEINAGTATEFDGTFQLTVPKTGTYEIEFNYVSYLSKKISVQIFKDTTFDIRLVSDELMTEEVEVIGKANKETNIELIKMQRNSATVVDGMNAETFKKTPDNKASDVFKRVSGATVQDNKFVIIRGLNDRYNFGLINGAPLPSSEPDRRAFSFDIFPSNMIDNLLIYKTATPDLPGEFSGGVININTTEPKEDTITSIQLGTSFNTITTFNNFVTYPGSTTDFLGVGAYSRQIPSAIPTTQEFAFLDKNQKAELAKLIPDNWSTQKFTSLPNFNLQSTINRNYKFGEKSSFGFNFGYNYNHNFNFSNLVRQEFEESATDVIKKMELKDSVFTQSVLHSALLNLSLNLGKNHIIKSKNLYSISSEDKLNIRNGVRELDNDPHQWEKSKNFWYTENKLLTSQLIGEHKFDNFKLDWKLGVSNVQRDIPNLKRVVYRKYSLFENDTTENYTAVVQNNGTIPTSAGNMFWSSSSENIYNSRVDGSYKIDIGKSNHELKAGSWLQYRNRQFTSRNLGFSQYRPNGSYFNSELLLSESDEIFSVENMGLLPDGTGGFKLEESTRVDDSYQAYSLLNAGYLMIDSKINDKIRINGGFRVESYDQNFKYIEDGSFVEKVIDTTVVDFLPSVNIIYSPNDKYKIRASYYKTVSRPEFRELAPFSFYNFINDNIISGDPYLKRSTINNADLRFEYYPSPEQMISISGFYKNFINPIEMINRTGTSGAPELYFANVTKVDNFGAELELKLKLSTFSKNKQHPILSNTNLFTNLSYINSNVDLAGYIGSGESRPLQGQSPYIINAGVFWQNPNKDWQASISYNYVAPRIYIVGNVQEPSVWEQGRHLLDFQFGKKFNKWELKLNVRDAMAQKLILFQDLNVNRNYDIDEDNMWQSATFGQNISISAKYNL